MDAVAAAASPLLMAILNLLLLLASWRVAEGRYFRIYTKTTPRLSLTGSINGLVTMSFGNGSSPYQQWSLEVASEGNNPSSALSGVKVLMLVNKATDMALKHGKGAFAIGEVTSTPYYNTDLLDVLWMLMPNRLFSEFQDFQKLRPLNQLELSLDVEHDDFRSGGLIKEGSKVIVYKTNDHETQLWKLEPLD